jgi:hypothetical protein
MWDFAELSVDTREKTGSNLHHGNTGAECKILYEESLGMLGD